MSASERRNLPGGWNIRWDAERAAEAYADGWWTRETSAVALRATAAADPARIVIVDGAVRISAGRLLDRAGRLARILASKMERGSVVSFMLPNWHEAAEIYFGVTMAGMVAHPVLPSLRSQELRFMLADVGSRMIFIPGTFRGHDYGAMLAQVATSLPADLDTVVLRDDPGPHRGYETLFASDPTDELDDPDPDTVRMVMYTSGTTGRPKGVLHTHNSLGALIRQIGAHWLIEPGDRFLVPSPISHIGGSIYAFEAPVMLGTTAVLMERWDPDEAIALIDAERCTHMAGATPFLLALLASALRAGSRLPSLKLFICGGASVPPALIREAASYFGGAAVSRVYGSTEVPVTTIGVPDRSKVAQAAETDGAPGIATVIIAEHDEIRAAGPQMLVGYVHIEDERDAFDRDGFYRTGDQGRVDESGHLIVTGRIKDLIIRNGENIAPKEVEDHLVRHAAVREIAIVGVPDTRTGERAVAVIVLRDGAKAPDTSVLSGFLTDLGVARFKHPEEVRIWDELPKNDAGKVLKKSIRDTLVAG